MSIEFQQFGPDLQRSTAEILLRQRIQQLCMRLIVKPIYSRPRYCTGVKIVVASPAARRLPGLATAGSDRASR
jgi:hypothetical protein